MPWRRLVREYVVYAAIMVAVLVLFFRDNGAAGLIGGVLVAGPVYVGLGAVMARFGYQRKTLKDLRTPRASPTPAAETAPAARTRPAPTKRTSTGHNQPGRPARKRR